METVLAHAGLLIAILLICAAFSRRGSSRYTGFCLEPRGSHETDPFAAQDNTKTQVEAGDDNS